MIIRGSIISLEVYGEDILKQKPPMSALQDQEIECEMLPEWGRIFYPWIFRN